MQTLFVVSASIAIVATVTFMHLMTVASEKVSSKETFSDAPELRVGIAVMMRNPQELPWWFDYHRRMGVTHFFVRLEDSPHWEDYVRGREDVALLQSGHSDVAGNNYQTQSDRQGKFVDQVLEMCIREKENVEFLFHIDQDELLHGSLAFLQSLPENVLTFTMKNTEAIYDVDTNDVTCFDAVDFRKCWEPGSECRAYANGKGGARVEGSVRYHGPHMFISDKDNSAYEVPFEDMHVRHYDSCTLGVFANKFHHMSKGVREDVIPFPAYLDSIRTVRQLFDKYKNIVHQKKGCSKEQQ